MGRLLAEIRRRGVLTVMTPYTIGAWLLLQVISVVAPALSMPDWTDTVFVVAAIAGFPIALYFSWFFELTEHGLRRTSPSTSEEQHLHLKPTHWVGLALTVLMSGGLAFGLYDSIRTRALIEAGHIEAPEEKSLAVLIFNDRSPDQSLSWLAEGLSEEIRIALGQIQGMKLAAMTSVQVFSEKKASPQEIGSALGVSTLLEGTVRLDGNLLKVSVALIEASSGRTLWSDRFERILDDVFAMEEEISRAIANRLMDGFTLNEGETLVFASGSSDAYVMHLKAREQFRKRNTESIKSARKLFEQSIAFDPEYAPAYVGVADCMLLLIRDPGLYGNIDREVALSVARTSLDKALLRAPELAGAYGTLGLLMTLSGDNNEAAGAFEKSLSLDPNQPKTLIWQYNLLKNTARIEDAMASLEEARSLDPLSPSILGIWNIELERRNRAGEALEAIETYLTVSPDDPIMLRTAGGVLARQLDFTGATSYLRRAAKASPDNRTFTIALASLFLDAGLAEEAGQLLGSGYDVNLAIARNDFDAALEIIRFDHKASPDDPFIAFEAGWYEMLYGEAAAGPAILLQAEAAIVETGWFDELYCSPQLELGFSHLMTGNPAAAAPYLDTCRTHVEEQYQSGYDYWELHLLAGRLAAIDANPEDAMIALQKAYETGWRLSWARHDPMLQDLKNHEPLNMIFRQIDEDLENLRESLRQTDITGPSGPRN